MGKSEYHTDDHTSAGMGPLPAAPGCTCQICRPGDDHHDDEDRAVIQTVLRHGWQVLLVGEGDQPHEPSFAYTIGLVHRKDHPELVISGLSGQLMHHALNIVAQRVMEGRRLFHGDFLEGVLGYVPLLVEELNDVGLHSTALWSRWFHRQPVRAFQLVWPDTSARFAWQPGAGAGLDELQPPHWRSPLQHVGPFAPDPRWPLRVPAELSVLACRHIIDDGGPACFVERQHGCALDGDTDECWMFHCGALVPGSPHPVGLTDFAPCHLSHVVRGTPSLREVADLGVGEHAWRENPDQPWKRSSKDGEYPLFG